MSQGFNEQSKGVYVISATPFKEDLSLDLESTDSLTDFYLEKGVDGITILGILGEAHKLTEEESITFMRRVVKRVNGRVPIVVGVSNPSNLHVERLTKQAMDDGAAGIMLAPVGGLKTDEQIYSYFTNIVDLIGSDVPVCYQDYPQSTGVTTSMACLNRVVRDFSQVVMLKHEEFPGLRKITQIRREEQENGQRRLSILVGNNGLYIPQEMRRGADGMMTGFSFPEMLVTVSRLFHENKPEEAEDVFDAYLPLVKHEYQFGFALAIRKEVLRRRGAIKSAVTRKPGPAMDQHDMVELDSLLARLERRVSALGM